MARTTIATPGFLDRLGDRVIVTDRTGGDLEVLRLRPELTADPAFERDLKARAEQLAAFQHRAAARVRGISRLPGADGRLAVVSDVAKGWRLSEVLQAAEHEGRLIHTSTVLFLLRQVASVAAALQATAPKIAHGALGPERVVLSPAGRVLVVEYVLGAALEHLPAVPADRIWKEYRLAVPGDAGDVRFGPETDVLQLGIIALSLVHNRLLKRDEYPGHLVALLDSATESQVTGARQPLGRALRDWLEHALGLRADTARWTMADAQHGLDWIVSAEGGYFSTPVGLEPLLQSVERFFNVPPAESDDAASEPLHSTTARIRPHTDSAAERAVASSAQTPPASLAPVPPVHAAAPAPSSAAQSVPAPDEPTDVEPVSAAPTLMLVKSDASVPVALPPATEILTGTRENELAADTPLVVASSPLAEFAAERVTDPFPAAPDLPAEAAGARPSLWPVPPAHALETPSLEEGPPGLAPVADMLSVDRPTGRRRSGWNGEAWLSRSSDRQPSGARKIVSGSGGVQSHPALGSAPHVAATPRLTRSGGPATAVALRAHETAPISDAVPIAETTPAAVRDPLPSPASGPHVAAAAPSPSPAAASASPPADVAVAGLPAAPTMPPRPMFGFSHEEGEEVATHPVTHVRGRSRSALMWPAVAAVVILFAGGFAAWKLLGSSPRRTAAVTDASPRAAASLPARRESNAAPAASVPQPAAVVPSSAPATSGAAPTEANPVTGSLQIVSPIVVKVTEKGEALGTSAAPIALAAGPHVIELSADEFGYRATRSVEVRAGRLTRAPLALPSGSVNINASPWAEVVVDGQRVGETPLGNVQLPIGPHEVRFKHPQLGEQVRTVMITTGAPGRLSVDMKQ